MMVLWCIIVHGQALLLKQTLSHRWFCFHPLLFMNGRFFLRSSVTHRWSCFGGLLYMDLHFSQNLLSLIDNNVFIHYCTSTYIFLIILCVSYLIVLWYIIVHGLKILLKSFVTHRWFCFDAWLFMDIHFFLKSSVSHRWSCFEVLLHMDVHFSENLLCLIDDHVFIGYCTWAYIFLIIFSVSYLIVLWYIIVHGWTLLLKSSVSHRWFCFDAWLFMDVHFFLKSSVSHRWSCFDALLSMDVHF